MYVIPLDRTSTAALHAQLADEIRHRITRGLFRVGDRLPSSRSLASSCGVGRNTVLAAYDQLIDQGWVEARVGQGTFVADRGPRVSPAAIDAGAVDAAGRSEMPWDRLVARLTVDGAGPSPVPAGAAIDFASAVPAAESYPLADIRRAFREVWREEGAAALAYGPPAGHTTLREVVAERSSNAGAAVDVDDVVIVGGLQRAVDLVARLLVTPGDRVVVEQPTYPHAVRVWQLNGAEVVGASMDIEGVRLDEMSELVDRWSPKLVSLMPTFHNPTGLTLSSERRQALMRVLQHARVPVVENHFDTDLRYRGSSHPPLKALDPHDQVFQLGTFSKILFPGLRLGWVIVPRALRDRLLSLKRTCDLATNLPAQIAVASFCRRGHLDRHLVAMRAEYTQRLDAMLEAIDAHLPSGFSTTRPEGGMTLWLTLPERTHSDRLAAEAAAAGVLIAPGTWFFAGDRRRGERHVRLSFVGEPPDRIEDGVRILGTVVKSHLRRARRRRTLPGDAPPFM